MHGYCTVTTALIVIFVSLAEIGPLVEPATGMRPALVNGADPHMHPPHDELHIPDWGPDKYNATWKCGVVMVVVVVGVSSSFTVSVSVPSASDFVDSS